MPPNVPNIITLSRIVLIPVMAYYLMGEAYRVALPLFLVAALTDFADGYIARKFKLASRLGAALDPVADKLNMLVATVLLAWQALIPIWLAIAIVVRDIVIVLGALAYRAALGHLDISPTAALQGQYVPRIHRASACHGGCRGRGRRRHMDANSVPDRLRNGGRVRRTVRLAVGTQSHRRTKIALSRMPGACTTHGQWAVSRGRHMDSALAHFQGPGPKVG